MGEPECIRRLDFLFAKSQRLRFQTGELVRDWRARYPDIFDDDDVRITVNQPTAHFYEWLAAVMFYESMGFRSLVEKYNCANHPAKFARFRKIVGEELFEQFQEGELRDPDLLVYSPDKQDEWFFSEVKGGSDRLSDEQSKGFKRLHEITGRRVCVLYLKEA